MVQLDGQQMGCASGQSFGDGAAAGADFNDCAAGEIAQGGRDALNGLGIDEEVLTELGFGRHELP